MKNFINMNFKAQALLMAMCIMLLGFTSCSDDDGGGDGGDSTPKEETIEALNGNWSLSGDSQLGNLETDAASVGVTVTETGFSLTGDITSYIDGGSWTVDESGDLVDPGVNVVSAELMLDGTPSVSMASDVSRITVSFDVVDAAARVGGIGAYELVMVKE